jgi:hypothetical protein
VWKAFLNSVFVFYSCKATEEAGFKNRNGKKEKLVVKSWISSKTLKKRASKINDALNILYFYCICNKILFETTNEIVFRFSTFDFMTFDFDSIYSP